MKAILFTPGRRISGRLKNNNLRTKSIFSEVVIEDKIETYSTISGYIIDELKVMPPGGDMTKPFLLV